MHGLRIYISTTNTPRKQRVFYSRRADGPYYRWRYEETLGRWCSSRVDSSDLTRMTLKMTGWKDVPGPLQSKLSEHYLD